MDRQGRVVCGGEGEIRFGLDREQPKRAVLGWAMKRAMIFSRRRVGRCEPSDLLFKPLCLRWSMLGARLFKAAL